METSDVAVAQFTSRATAKTTLVGFGFRPAVVLAITNVEGANPNIRIAYDTAQLTQITGGETLLINGADGVVSSPAGAVISFSDGGGDKLGAVAGRTVDVYSPKGTDIAEGLIPPAGVAIDSTIQTNSGKNIVIGFRNNR